MSLATVAAGDFATPLDIANRALQHVGARRIASFTEDSKNASAVSFCYDKLRRSELRRAVWVSSIKKTVLRPLDTTSMRLIFPAYDATKTYLAGAVVTLTDQTYIARGAVALAKSPDLNPDLWGLYFGQKTSLPWDSTTAYYAGEIVYWPATGAAVPYLSLVSSNSDTPGTAPAYDATVIYSAGDTVTYSAVVYQSTVDLNLNSTPTGTGNWVTVPATQAGQQYGQKWLKLTATLIKARITYPLDSGPRSETSTANVFELPMGWLREAPQDPKAGSFSYLGAPSGAAYADWLYEGNYLVSHFNDLLVYRFAADIAYVSEMDPMFCERLAARIALEICEELTQSVEKLQGITALYKRFGDDAIAINAIIKGPEEPPEDDYIACRQ